MQRHIQKFIDALQDSAGKVNPIYRRNFRELIKVIPIVGSWIDANTMGAIEDAALEERLNNLDSACSRALSLNDADLLIAEIANINSIFFVILLTKLGNVAEQNLQLSGDIGNLLSRVEEQNATFRPHRNFRFVTISGASASGKDCVLDLILHRVSKAHVPVEALTKFTTREKRVVDSKYYDFITEAQFDLLEKGGQIIFPYYKRGARYGFDRTHLFNAARKEGVLFCVFTHFESLPADRQFLKNQGIQHIAILLHSDKDSLFLRSESRMLKKDDIRSRIHSIEQDLAFLEENGRYIQHCFDLVVENGDGHAKWDSHDKIVEIAGLPELAFTNAFG